MRATSPRSNHFLLVAGVVLLVLLHLLHFADVLHLTAGTPLAPWSLLVRANMTPFAWCAYLLVLLGWLTWLDGNSYLARFRNRFLVCWLWAVPAWCYFDWMNFYFMSDRQTGQRAWEYIHLPVNFGDRLVGYLIAFGAIAPGMFLTADVLQRLGFRKIRTGAHFAAPLPLTRSDRRRENYIAGSVLALGLLLAPIPILVGTPASNLAIWVGTWALLDPINRYFGRPSLLADWFDGRWGRTLSLGAGGLFCGFLWEFWNYWSFTKWKYHLPFLGGLEHFRYFEMPVAGLLGFIAFALETWAMWQTSLLILAPFIEAEKKTPADQFHHDHACL